MACSTYPHPAVRYSVTIFSPGRSILFFELPHENTPKTKWPIKGNLSWDQEKHVDERKKLWKSHDTVSLKCHLVMVIGTPVGEVLDKAVKCVIFLILSRYFLHLPVTGKCQIYSGTNKWQVLAYLTHTRQTYIITTLNKICPGESAGLRPHLLLTLYVPVLLHRAIFVSAMFSL